MAVLRSYLPGNASAYVVRCCGSSGLAEGQTCHSILRTGELSLRLATRILRRHWWIPPVMALLLGSAGYLATLVLPRKYTSSTLVGVEHPAVPAKLVKPVVSDDLDRRVASIEEQILRRSRLQPIVEQLH